MTSVDSSQFYFPILASGYNQWKQINNRFWWKEKITLLVYVYCIKILKIVEWIQLKVSSLSIELGTLNLDQIGPIPCCLHQPPFTKLPQTSLKAWSKLGFILPLLQLVTWLSLEDQNFSSVLCLRAIYLFWFCNTCFELESPVFNWVILFLPY